MFVLIRKNHRQVGIQNLKKINKSHDIIRVLCWMMETK